MKRLLAILLLSVETSWATLSVASRTDGWSGASVTTISATKISHTTGNLLVVFLAIQSVDGDGSITIGDTAGNTYHKVGTTEVQSENRLRMYEAFNITGNANNVVSSSWSTVVGTYHYIDVYEINSTVGSFASDPFAVAASTGGNSTSLDSGNLSPVSNSAIIIAGAEADGGSLVAGTNYTLVTDVGAGGGGFEAGEFHIVSAAEHATATATTGLWGITAAAFNEPTLGGGVSMQRQRLKREE